MGDGLPLSGEGLPLSGDGLPRSGDGLPVDLPLSGDGLPLSGDGVPFMTPGGRLIFIVVIVLFIVYVQLHPVSRALDDLVYQDCAAVASHLVLLCVLQVPIPTQAILYPLAVDTQPLAPFVCGQPLEQSTFHLIQPFCLA